MPDNGAVIEKLKFKLNRWRNEAPPVRRSGLPPAQASGAAAWTPPPPRPRSRLFAMKNILITSIFFFAAMIAVTVWVFYRGDNVVSIGNIDLEVSGPSTVRAGEETALQLSISNRNSTSLQFVDLIVTYPPGTRSAVNPAAELSRERFSLGTIKPGETKRQALKAILFGEEKSQSEIRITTEYRLADSNAIFDKTTVYPLELSAAPVSLGLAVPAEITSGQEITLDVSVLSDAKTKIEDPKLVLHYPPGFQFGRASLKPSAGNNLWSLGTLAPGQKVQFSVTGLLIGNDNENKAFRAEVGSGTAANGDGVAVLFDTELQSVAIKRPYVTFLSTVNGSGAKEVPASSRETLQMELTWENNLSDPLQDLEIIAELDGTALDRESVVVGDGFYRSSDNSIVWNGSSNPALARLAPGEIGRVKFSFASVSLGAAGSANPTIGVRSRLKGKRVEAGGGGKTQAIESAAAQTIKLNSVVQLAAKALHYSGPFSNGGPMPPRVGESTAYTVIWSVVNSSNDLSDGRVQATLPPYIKWLDRMTPAGEKLEFVAAPGGGGEVIWTLGTVRAGTGLRTAAREVSFQIALEPGLGQVGDAPALLSAPRFSASDTFTKQAVNGELRRTIDTNLTADPNFRLGEDKVIK